MVTRRSRKPVKMDICVQTETAAQPLFASEDSADRMNRRDSHCRWSVWSTVYVAHGYPAICRQPGDSGLHSEPARNELAALLVKV